MCQALNDFKTSCQISKTGPQQHGETMREHTRPSFGNLLKCALVVQMSFFNKHFLPNM